MDPESGARAKNFSIHDVSRPGGAPPPSVRVRSPRGHARFFLGGALRVFHCLLGCPRFSTWLGPRWPENRTAKPDTCSSPRIMPARPKVPRDPGGVARTQDESNLEGSDGWMRERAPPSLRGLCSIRSAKAPIALDPRAGGRAVDRDREHMSPTSDGSRISRRQRPTRPCTCVPCEGIWSNQEWLRASTSPCNLPAGN